MGPTRQNGDPAASPAAETQPTAQRPSVASLMVGAIVLAALFFISRYNYLLFHSLAELFSIAVAWGVFMLVYNARRFLGDDALVLLGVAYLFVGLLDLLHTMAYRGMGIFPGFAEANLATQLWVAARYLESLGILAFAFFLGRRVRHGLAFVVFASATAVLLGGIFVWPVFPVCFDNAAGLTPFKIVSEYAVCLVLAGSLLGMFKKRETVRAEVLWPMAGAIVLTIGSELAFTLYRDVFGLPNLIGHYMKIVSFILVYQALIRSGLTQPYSVLYSRWRELEQHFNQLVDAMPISVMRFDREGAVTHVNPYHLRTFGAGRHAAAYFLGRKIHELPGVVKAGVSDRLERVLAGESVTIADAYFPEFTGGHSGHQRILAVPLLAPGGAVVGGFLLREDITDMRRHEQLFARALTTIPDGYWLVDNDGCIRESNAAACHMLGYPPGGLNGLHIDQIDCAESETEVQRHIDRIRQVGHDRFETCHRHRDGRPIDVEVGASYLAYGGGHFVVIIRDIAERKLAAQRLKLSETKFATAFYRSPMPMAINDIDDETYIDVNDAFVRTTGYLKRDCLGRRGVDIGIIDGPQLQRLKTIIMADQRLAEVEVRLRRKTGTRLVGQYWAETISIGGKLRLLSIIRDITEEKQAEKERDASERLLRLISQPSDLAQLARDAVDMLQAWSGCQAVGLRLKAGDAFPYAAESGFPEKMDPAQLAAPDPDEDAPVCVCRAILSGRFDRQSAGGTETGSFWSNRVSAEAERAHQADHPFHPGPCCRRGGFESVALIPLRFGDTVLGLLQFADPGGDLFDHAMIQLLERLAGKLAVAVQARRDMAALHESEHRYRTLYENAPVGLFSSTASGRVLAFNPEMARILGYDRPAEAIANYTDLGRQMYVDPEQRQLFVDQLTASGHVKGFEFEAIGRQGRKLWLRVDARLGERLPDGDTTIEGFSVDVTSRRQHEAQLQLQAMVLDQIHDQVVVTDLDGRISYVNEAQVRALGFRREEMVGKRTTVFGENGHADASQQEILARTLADGHWHGEVVNVTSTGERRILELRTRRVSDADGQRVALFGVAQDITEKRRRDYELRRLASAIDQAAESIMITDADGTILFVNPSFERITGYAGEEVLGRNPRIFKSGEQDGRFYSNLWKTITAGRTWSGQMTNCRKDGSRYIEKGTISPVFNADGTIINFVSVRNDVTDEIQMAAKLDQAQKMEAIGTLAGGIAHDFNNILFPMVGYTEMLREDLPADSPLQDYVTDILAASMRARDLVQQILAFSRQTHREPTAIRVQQVFKEAIKLTRASLPSNIEIKTDIDTACPPVFADPTQVHQIIMNLITNAYHAMESAGGVLTLALAPYTVAADAAKTLMLAPGDYVRLTVADTGHGIDEAVRARIFEPYFTTKAEGKGTGLGLSVIHGIVAACQGDIQVESQTGRGSTFHVFLPSMQRDSRKPAEESHAPIPGGTERILLVDDEKAIVSMVEKMLSRLGYAITCYTDSEAALAAFRETPERFDLVVTDMTMPGITGDRLTMAVKQIRPDIPVVLCTGFSNQIDADRAAKMGIAGFVLKPILKRNIAETLRKALDARSAPESG